MVLKGLVLSGNLLLLSRVGREGRQEPQLLYKLEYNLKKTVFEQLLYEKCSCCVFVCACVHTSTCVRCAHVCVCRSQKTTSDVIRYLLPPFFKMGPLIG